MQVILFALGHLFWFNTRLGPWSRFALSELCNHLASTRIITVLVHSYLPEYDLIRYYSTANDFDRAQSVANQFNWINASLLCLCHRATCWPTVWCRILPSLPAIGHCHLPFLVREFVSFLGFSIPLLDSIFQNIHVITCPTTSLLPEPHIARCGHGYRNGHYVYSGPNHNITLFSREEVHGHGNCDFWWKIIIERHFCASTDRLNRFESWGCDISGAS